MEAIESKSFEISIEEVNGDLLGKVVERDRSFSSWIRFGEFRLSRPLERVELCCWEEKVFLLLQNGRKGGEGLGCNVLAMVLAGFSPVFNGLCGGKEIHSSLSRRQRSSRGLVYIGCGTS